MKKKSIWIVAVLFAGAVYYLFDWAVGLRQHPQPPVAANPLPEPVQASLYAADGRLLRSWTLNAGDTQRLQTEGLQQGVYIIRFGNTGKTYKLVKE